MFETIVASSLADLTASDFASAVYNIFFAALVFGVGWLVVRYMDVVREFRDLKAEFRLLDFRLTNLEIPPDRMSTVEDDGRNADAPGTPASQEDRDIHDA